MRARTWVRGHACEGMRARACVRGHVCEGMRARACVRGHACEGMRARACVRGQACAGMRARACVRGRTCVRGHVRKGTEEGTYTSRWIEALAACGIPPNVLDNRSFRHAVKKTALKGKDCKYSGLTRNYASTTVLDRLHTRLTKVQDGHIEKMKKTKRGCTILYMILGFGGKWRGFWLL